MAWGVPECRAQNGKVREGGREGGQEEGESHKALQLWEGRARQEGTALGQYALGQYAAS